jgi:rhodanese-related sulfurtransferase
MRKLILFLLAPFLACAQTRHEHPPCQSKAFDKTLESLLQFSVPLISCKDLNENRSQYFVLDARERDEYNVSHIANARFIGYDKFDLSLVKDIPPTAHIVVYCSVGYRSEKVGEKLMSAGFKNVKNLYGSIFEWVNMGLPVENNHQVKVKKVHAYNRTWGQWVTAKDVEKIYGN